MLLRWVLFITISLFSTVSFSVEESAEKTVENAIENTQEVAQTLFELERGVAILQLSKANLDDYRNMDASVSNLSAVVDFFAAVTFALLIALVVLMVQVRRLKARLLVIEEQERPQIKD